jgi:predicted aspartyl protease
MRIFALGAALLAASPAGAEPLEMFNNRPFVAVIVNGQPTTGLLDTAAEMTLLDDDFAARLGLVASGSATAHGSGAQAMEARFAEHVLLRAAGTSTDQQVAILDLDEVGQRLVGRRIDLLIGRDFFDRARLRIDPRAGTVEAFSGRPRGVRLTLGEHRGVPTVPAAIEGHPPVQAVIDTGNGTEVLIGRAYAERVGLTAPDRIVGRNAGGGLGGERQRDLVTLRSLSVAGRTFRDVPAAIDVGATASDLNIGMSILSHFRITTDFARHAIWLEPIE